MDLYDIDMALEEVMDDMDDYDYGYDDIDEFCDALESMVYDMADYLCYEEGYSENEALEAANVYYGCALETSSQIKQVRNQARKTYNKARKAAKRGDTYTARQLSAQAMNLDKKVHKAKDKVDAAVNVSSHQYDKRSLQHDNKMSQRPGYTKNKHGQYSYSKNSYGVRKSNGTQYQKHYYDSATRAYDDNFERGSRGYERQQNRRKSDYDVH